MKGDLAEVEKWLVECEPNGKVALVWTRGQLAAVGPYERYMWWTGGFGKAYLLYSMLAEHTNYVRALQWL